MGPIPDSPDIDPDALTPTTQSSAISTNELEEVEGDMVCSVPKKKKKKKTKKHAKVQGAVAAVQANTQQESDGRPVLCISRNKHWRYISSYHVSLFIGRYCCRLTAVRSRDNGYSCHLNFLILSFQ